MVARTPDHIEAKNQIDTGQLEQLWHALSQFFLSHKPISEQVTEHPYVASVTDTDFRIDQPTAQERLYEKIREQLIHLEKTDERWQAWEALTNPRYAQEQCPILKENPYYKVWHDLIEVKSGKVIWRKRQRQLTTEAFDNFFNLQSLLHDLTGDVADLYRLANTFLDQEIRGMNDHSLIHIEEVMNQVVQLFIIACQLRPHGYEPTLRDYCQAQLTVLFHDCAQALFGRAEHGKWGGMVMLLLLQVQPGMEALLNEVYFNVTRHGTKDFEFDVNKRSINSLSYDLSVLADESDIGAHRITAAGRQLYLAEGVADSDIEFNLFTQETEWLVGDDGVVIWKLKTSIGSVEACELYLQHLRARLGEDALDDIEQDHAWIKILLQESYLRLVKELLLSHKKLNLLKSLCKTVFGTTAFRIEAVDCKGKPLEHRGVPVIFEPS